MITKKEQITILENFFNLGKYKYHLIDEYSEIDEIRRHNEQNQEQMQFEAKKSTIFGIVQTLPSQLAPVENLNSIQSTQLITFFVPNLTASDTNPLGTEARAIIQDLNDIAMAITGKSGSIAHAETTTTYVLAPNLPVVGQETNMLGYYAVDVTLTVGWQMMENGVISNTTKLLIDGNEAVWLSLSVVRTRVPEAVNFAGSAELQSDIIQQGLTISFAMPLQNNSVAWMFYLDSLDGPIDKKYTVEYTTGTKTLSTTMVATQISSNLEIGKVGSVRVELTTAVSGGK